MKMADNRKTNSRNRADRSSSGGLLASASMALLASLAITGRNFLDCNDRNGGGGSSCGGGGASSGAALPFALENGNDWSKATTNGSLKVLSVAAREDVKDSVSPSRQKTTTITTATATATTTTTNQQQHDDVEGVLLRRLQPAHVKVFTAADATADGSVARTVDEEFKLNEKIRCLCPGSVLRVTKEEKEGEAVKLLFWGSQGGELLKLCDALKVLSATNRYQIAREAIWFLMTVTKAGIFLPGFNWDDCVRFEEVAPQKFSVKFLNLGSAAWPMQSQTTVAPEVKADINCVSKACLVFALGHMLRELGLPELDDLASKCCGAVPRTRPALNTVLPSILEALSATDDWKKTQEVKIVSEFKGVFQQNHGRSRNAAASSRKNSSMHSLRVTDGDTASQEGTQTIEPVKGRTTAGDSLLSQTAKSLAINEVESHTTLTSSATDEDATTSHKPKLEPGEGPLPAPLSSVTPQSGTALRATTASERKSPGTQEGTGKFKSFMAPLRTPFLPRKSARGGTPLLSRRN